MVDKKPIGFPMGIKVNEEDLVNGLSLEQLVELTELYHGGNYVIGFDTLYVEKKHYHIHWLSIKETSEGALKTFRSNVLKKKFPHLPRSFRLSFGKDLPSADPMYWISYAIKENVIRMVGYELTEQMRIDCKSHLEIKRLKSIKSEQKAVEQKQKQDFKDKMFLYVSQNMPETRQIGEEYYCREFDAFSVTVIEYMETVDKFGSMKLNFLRQYYTEFKMRHSPDRWKAVDVYKFISGLK